MKPFNSGRLKTLIDVMQRVVDKNKPFDMQTWQDMDDVLQKASTEEELHTCGTTACIAGYLAVSPEFKKAGGKVSRIGAPIFDGVDQYRAIESYLECSMELAELITDPSMTDIFYDAEVRYLTPKIVVSRLNGLLELGEY